MPSLDPSKAPDASGDDGSPTSKVHSYLRSKGLQPTHENVKRALSENARNPGTIAGLSNEEPPADDRKGSGKARTSSNSSGGRSDRKPREDSAPKGKTSSLPTPPIPPDQTRLDVGRGWDTPTGNPVGGGGASAPTTAMGDPAGVASPTGAAGDLPFVDQNGIGDLIAAILGGGALGGAGLYGYSRFANRQPGAQFAGNAGPPPFRPGAGIDVLPDLLASTQPQLLTDQRMPPRIGRDPYLPEEWTSEPLGGVRTADVLSPEDMILNDRPIDLTPRQNQFPPQPQRPQIGMTERPPIAMPDQTSGPTISLGDSSAGRMTSAPPTEPMPMNLLPDDALTIQTNPQIGPRIQTDFVDAPHGLGGRIGGGASRGMPIIEDLMTFIRGAGARR